MSYLGDYAEDATLYFTWGSNDTNGASITRTTDGEVRVYKNGSVTQSIAGVTDTEDFDGLTGVHLCTIDLSADAFYAIGGDYAVVLQGAVIDGQTVNAPLAHFSIENRFDHDCAKAAALATHDAKLDTADAAIDAAASDVTAIKAKTDNLPGSPAAVGSAMTLDTDAVNAASLAADAASEIEAAVWAGSSRTLSDKTGFKLASDGLDSISTTEPGGVASTFTEMVVQTWRRFFKKTTLTASEFKAYKDNNDVATTQAASDDGTTQTIDGAI